MGAAIACCTIFSIAPLLLIAIAVAGLAFEQEAASGEVMAQLGGMMGQDGGSTVGGPSERSSQAQVARKSGTCGVGLLGLLPRKSAYWRAPVLTLSAKSRRWRQAACWHPEAIPDRLPERGPADAGTHRQLALRAIEVRRAA
jgi:hypothetical protein